MGENKFNLRGAACSMHCSASRSLTDSFYLNGKLPGAYLADNTQTETSPTVSEGVFAVFSGLHPSDKVKIGAIDEFRTSIIKSGTVAINACVENLNENLKASKDYSFAMVKLKNDIAQIYYRGDCSVYIYRNNKVISLTDARVAKKAENKQGSEDVNAISFTPEFKFIKNDALILCTGGVKEKLSEKIFAHILDNTKGCKAAAQSITISSNENHCVNDATAIVIRATEKKADSDSNLPKKLEDVHNQTEKKSVVDADATKSFDSNLVKKSKPEKIEAPSYRSYDEFAIDDDTDDNDSLGLSKAAWAVIGVLTAALGVIAGLVVLIYI